MSKFFKLSPVGKDDIDDDDRDEDEEDDDKVEPLDKRSLRTRFAAY